MNWKIIKENQRKYADNSYFLEALRECPEGTLKLEISWIERFMYDVSVHLIPKNTRRRFLGRRQSKEELIYSCLVFYNDRIEKYGHQIMRITNVDPLVKLKRLNSLQKDAVLNYNISEKCNITFLTTLPEK